VNNPGGKQAIATRADPGHPTGSGGKRTKEHLGASGDAVDERGSVAIRLADRTANPNMWMSVEGTRKQVLNPFEAEHSFSLSLDEIPEHPILSFWTGLKPGEEPVTIQFEVEIQPPSGPPIGVYKEKVTAAGWRHRRIDLREHDLAGNLLVLRRRLIDGPLVRFLRSDFGDAAVLPRDASHRRGVIMISIDTLRADHVGIYGHNKGSTPNLDAVAKAGVWYENAYSPSTWTVPSHASMFYGDLRQRPPQKPGLGTSTNGDIDQSIAEIFREAGYLTAGFTGGGWMNARWGFSQGFDTYYAFNVLTRGPGQPCRRERFDGADVFGRAITWLRDRGNVPFFLFLHTYNVHDKCPFTRPTGTPGSVDHLTHAERLQLIESYGSLVAESDVLLGQLLGALTELDLVDTTLLVVTSDHGEAFWEHGFHGHGCPHKPYEELVRVPLLLRYPAVIEPRGRVAEPVSLIDVVPTVVRLMGLTAPAGMQNRALPGVGLPRSSEPQAVYVNCGDLLAVRTDGLKLITSRGDVASDEIYDLSIDPSEQRNIALERSSVADRLRQLATEFWGRSTRSTDSATLTHGLDDETVEQLRALGYAVEP
jgi:arylsulfatase A-like enzyme